MVEGIERALAADVPSKHRAPGGVFSEDELVPSERLFASAFYLDFTVPNNMRYGAINLLNMSLREIDSVSRIMSSW
jgi:hypothetical protein